MLEDAKADDVTVLDVRPRQCDFTDEIVIATARSKLHCQSAAQAVVYRVGLVLAFGTLRILLVGRGMRSGMDSLSKVLQFWACRSQESGSVYESLKEQKPSHPHLRNLS